MNILFVGNSHTFFNDMPRTFARLWEAGTGEAIRPPMLLCHPGMGFDYHLREYFELRYNLLYGGFDYVVFQQKAHPFAGEEADFEAGKKLALLAKKAGVTPVFALTWAEADAPEHQAAMDSFHRRLCQETGALLSPVGTAWQLALGTASRLALCEAQRPQLYWQDGQHASVYGDYLVACTHYRLLSGRSALGLPSLGCDFSDPDKPGILEDAGRCESDLDPAVCAVIQQAVEAAFDETNE